MGSSQRIVQSRTQLAALGKIDTRTQFGGYSLAVEKVVFALVSEGELYLRASEQLKPYIAERQLKPLIFNKCGLPVTLNYYQIDEFLWNDPPRLLALSRSSLRLARQQKLARKKNIRLKDLPNMGIRMEMLLRAVGICSVKALRQEGAKRCWLKLKAINNHLGINILFALQGAISGQHQAALPAEVKDELRAWYNHMMKYGKPE